MLGGFWGTDKDTADAPHLSRLLGLSKSVDVAAAMPAEAAKAVTRIIASI